jgi:hypothetical protein
MREVRDERICRQVLRHANRHPCNTRSDLVASLAEEGDGFPGQLVDAVLFWLRQIGMVHFNLSGGSYGDETIITAA